MNLQKKCPNVILGDKGQHEIAQNFTNSCTANSIVALLPHFFNNELNKDFILSVLHSGRVLYCKVDDGNGNYTFADQYDGETFIFGDKKYKIQTIYKGDVELEAELNLLARIKVRNDIYPKIEGHPQFACTITRGGAVGKTSALFTYNKKYWVFDGHHKGFYVPFENIEDAAKFISNDFMLGNSGNPSEVDITDISLSEVTIVGSIGQCSLATNESSLPTCKPHVSIENLQEKCPSVIIGDEYRTITSPPQVDQPTPPPSRPHVSPNFSNQVINVSLLNVRSVRAKSSQLRNYIIEKKLHVFCMVETWLTEGDTSVIASFLPDTHVFIMFPGVIAEAAVLVLFCRKTLKM